MLLGHEDVYFMNLIVLRTILLVAFNNLFLIFSRINQLFIMHVLFVPLSVK